MALRFTPRGNALYEPDGEVLEEYFWDRGRFICIQGPIGSGTSTCSCHRIWALACEQEPDYDGVRRSRWIVSRTTYKELRETTIKTWLEWFPESEWGQFIRAEPGFHHLKRDHPSGDGTKVDCEVIFLALPDTQTAVAVLASFEITGFFVNECQNTEKGVIDELLSRCSRYPSMKNGAGPTWFGGFADMNAPTEGHWVPYMRGDIPLPPDMSDEEKSDFQRPDNWRFVVQPAGLIRTKVDGKVVYQPNPAAENQRWLAEPYIEKIKGKTEAWIKQRVMNEVGLYVEGKAVYPTFDETVHVSRRTLEPVQGHPIIVGLDFGREPAAVFLQDINNSWRMLDELVGDNESAEKFAPRVKQRLLQKFPGFRADFFGDPRGADGGQNVETTAYDIFLAHGMRVFPATPDNNVEMRRSTMESVLARRNGLLIDPGCLITKTGMAGGYHYPQIKIRGMTNLYSEKPRKNRYSHPVEALENALMGGGEGHAVIIPTAHQRPKISKIHRHRVSLRRSA